ncbi:MAG: RNA polymerase sigma-70 factor, partial [Verrucomicrobia bacterium]|nr:RNA polymerase sigma-70 factor [Prolixibacteraceae bacterium]
LKEGDEHAFKALFQKYYSAMCQFAYQFLKDSDMAEETVQELFVRLWEKRATLNIELSVNHYLFRSIRNQCLNQLQHQKIKQQYASRMLENAEQETDWQPFYLEMDLMERIEKSIDSMPPKRQEIFRLSREQGLKYKEIADKLNISIKTVEAQMGLALKYLRDDLKDFNPSLISLLIILKKTTASNKG